MEDKLPPKESHVWTLSDFIERRKDWDQGDEAKLAEYLQQLSNKITQGAKSTLNELDDLICNVENTFVKISNINNEFQLLADKQFIENKVQEEDETVQTIVEKPVVKNKVDNADLLVNNLKESLKYSFKAIDLHFEKITVVVSDSDDDDELKHEETVLRPRTFYKKLNLPSLSGNTQCEIIVNNTMSSDSDSDVQEPPNVFKNEESLSSNDVPEEDFHSISESKLIHESNHLTNDTYSNIFQPKQLKPKNDKNDPPYPENTEDDLFSPPPLLNDNNDDDLDNEYNIFGNGNSNIYDEKNLWEDDDDDDDNFSNQPPLPICSDELPQQNLKYNVQEKNEEHSVQQSLNDELRKRFQKDNINVESPIIKLPKGAVNILGGANTKPHIADSAQKIKQTTISQISRNLADAIQDSNYKTINNDFSTKNQLFGNSKQVTSTQKDLDFKKEPKPTKTRSFFEQDSDDEDLFVEKTSNIIPATKPDISKQKENPIMDNKLSRPIFSESDSDEEFTSLKSTTMKKVPHSTINNDSTNNLDSSSEDDLFSTNSNNKKIVKKQESTLFSLPVHNVLSESGLKKNEIKSKSSIKDKQILDKEIIDEVKSNAEESTEKADNTIIKTDYLSNNNTINITESLQSKNSTIVQSNKKNIEFQHTKKFDNLFSSDEDDFDDDTLFNVKTNYIKNDQIISDSINVTQNTNNKFKTDSKKEIFYSSSDDDIFSTNKSNNNLISTINNKQTNYKEIKTMEPKSNDNCAIIVKKESLENIDKIQASGNTNLSLLSDDEDDDYLSFNNVSDCSMNISNEQNIDKNIKKMSTSSEEFLNSQMDTKNENVFNNMNENLVEEKERNITKNEMLANSEKIKIQSIFSKIDRQELSHNSNITIEDSKIKTKLINPLSDDSLDGSSFSSSNSNIETPKKLPGKLNKNAGNFINIAGLLPNSKSLVKKPDIPRSASLDENNGDLPTSGTKLFSIEKERPKIQVKRRPQSRKARIAAARVSSIDIGHESNIQENSRLSCSTSDLVDYQASPILINDENNEKEIQTPFDNNFPGINDDKMYESNKKPETNEEIKKKFLDIFDSDSDSFESIQEETNSKNSYKKEYVLDEKLESKSVNEKVPEIVLVHKHNIEIEQINEKQPDIEAKNEEELIFEKHTDISPICDKKVIALDVNKLEKKNSKFITQNTKILNKSNSLFDDGDDDDIFSPRRDKVNKTSSNIFDSDDEFEFKQTFNKNKSIKSISIFGDESDDDLFSNSSTSNLISKTPIDKLNQQHNRTNTDGYVKLTAESVAVNPLEPKKN